MSDARQRLDNLLALMYRDDLRKLVSIAVADERWQARQAAYRLAEEACAVFGGINSDECCAIRGLALGETVPTKAAPGGRRSLTQEPEHRG